MRLLFFLGAGCPELRDAEPLHSAQLHRKMALEDLYDLIIAHAASVIRNNAVMPRLIDPDIAGELSLRGGSVNVSVSKPKQSKPVIPGPTPPGGERSNPDVVPVSLDFWEDVDFSLTDRDVSSMESSSTFLPNELQESAIAIANRVDATIIDNYKGVPGVAGVAGVTPFSVSTLEAQQTIQVLLAQGVPLNAMKHMVLNPFAYTNAIGLESIQHADKYGDSTLIKTGQIPHALGFSWHADQNMVTHETGAAGVVLVDGANQIGTILRVDGVTAPPIEGDVFSIAGDTQTYTVLTATNTAGTDYDLLIYPAMAIAPPDNALLTFVADHAVNLAFHPSAFAFASRVAGGLQMSDRGPVVRTFVDDVSGLVFTLRINPEHYQTSFYLSCLWGTELIDGRRAVRLLG